VYTFLCRKPDWEIRNVITKRRIRDKADTAGKEERRMKMKRSLLVLVAFAAASHASPLIVPTLTVLGANAADGLGFDAGGPAFTVAGNLLGTDTLSLMVSGTVDLAGGGFTANAAGIVTAPATTNTGVHPGQTTPNSGNALLNYGALLIGNSTLGFFQVFPSSAAFGLGSGSPPTTLVLTNRTLANIGFTAGLSNGTILELRVSDTNSGDNSGQFLVTQSSVPEPATFGLLSLGLGMMLSLRRRT